MSKITKEMAEEIEGFVHEINIFIDPYDSEYEIRDGVHEEYEGLEGTLYFTATSNEDDEVWATASIEKWDYDAMTCEECTSLCCEIAAELEKIIGSEPESSQPVWVEWQNGKMFFNYEV